MIRVAVVGGGISGLAAAWDLRRGGAEVRVFEAGPRTGGCIATHRRGAYRFEAGPTAVQGDVQHFRDLAADLGLGGDVVEARSGARVRYLYHHGGLDPLPRTLGEFVRTPLFTARQKMRAVLEPLVRRGHPDREETVAEFFGRRVGRGITMTWVDVIVSAACAGNPNRLGIRSAFPNLARMELEHGSIFRAMKHRERSRRKPDGTIGASPLLTLRHGLEQLPATLRAALGDRVLVGRCVRRIGRRPGGGLRLHIEGDDGHGETVEVDRLLLAVPAPTAGILIGPLASEAADLIFEIDAASVVMANAAFPRDEVPGLPRGFGYLVPRSMRMRTLGWIFGSQLFPEAAPEDRVLLSGFVGGVLDPRIIDLDDAALRWLMVSELALALGQRKNPRPEMFELTRWPEALPQYNVGHRLRMAAVRKLLEEQIPEIAVAGNWVAGFTIDHCIRRAREAAGEILGAARGTAPALTGGAA